MKIKSHLQLKARFLGAVLVLSLVPAYAQYTKASLSGTVADSSGALLSAAAVTVESRETGYRQQQSTSGQGMFLFPELPVNLFNNVNFNNPGRICQRHRFVRHHHVGQRSADHSVRPEDFVLTGVAQVAGIGRAPGNLRQRVGACHRVAAF